MLIAEPARMPARDQQGRGKTDESNARVQLHAKPIPPIPPPRSGFVQQTDRAADVLPQGGPHPLSQRTGRNAQLLPPRSRVNYHCPWSAEFFGSTGVGFHLSGRCSRRRLLPACHVKGFFPQLKKYWKGKGSGNSNIVFYIVSGVRRSWPSLCAVPC